MRDRAGNAPGEHSSSPQPPWHFACAEATRQGFLSLSLTFQKAFKGQAGQAPQGRRNHSLDTEASRWHDYSPLIPWESTGTKWCQSLGRSRGNQVKSCYSRSVTLLLPRHTDLFTAPQMCQDLLFFLYGMLSTANYTAPSLPPSLQVSGQMSLPQWGLLTTLVITGHSYPPFLSYVYS